MIIVCPSCQARYKFDETKLGQRPKAKTKCAKCGSAIEIENPLFGAMTLPPSPEAPAAPAPAPAAAAPAPRSWQFDTSADKANKALLEDLILRKKGGYYDAFKNTYNSYNTTNIEHQTNCNVTATSAGNSGNNANDGSASSPIVSNDGTNTASATGNTSSNGLDADGPSGVVLAPNGDPVPVGSVDNNQDNSGAQTAGVDSSSNAISSGAINAGGGQNSQVLNSDQSNNGSTQAANVTNSTACSLASAGGALN